MLRLLLGAAFSSLLFSIPLEAHDHHGHHHADIIVEDHHDYVNVHHPWYHHDHVYLYNGHAYPYYYSGRPYYYYDPRFYYYSDLPESGLNVHVNIR